MARKPIADFCFVCGEAPCTCNKKPAKKAAPQAPRPPETRIEAVPPPVVSKPTLSGFRAPPPKKVAPVILNTTPDPDAELAALKRAVTILVEAGLVSGESITEHRNLIDLTDGQILQIRASEWKRRRESRANGTDK